VFFVGLEKTGKLYGYVFNSNNTFTRVATIATGFQTIQDLLWDPTQDALWATCDNGCQGRSSIIRVDAAADAHTGTFQVDTVYSRPTGATQNLNNEGFTVAPISECVNGSRRAYWSDDSDDGNHWLRTASVDCTADTTPPAIAVPSAEVTVEATGAAGATVSYASLVSITDASGLYAPATSCSPASGSLFPLGTTTVTCQATDLAGNSASRSFTVQVLKSGKLSVGPGESVVVPPGTTITGPVTVEAGGSIRICGTAITGPLTITGATGSVVVGDGTAACAGNTITGPVRITGNHGGVVFDGNTVNGPLTITGNTGTVEATANTVSGKANVQP
jgi:hypothetical protein